MVLVSTGITDEERKSYKKVVEKLDEYFHVRHNVIFERARFNRRDQLEGESGDQYITELYYLAERCSYGQLTSEMIRDRLVVGIRDLALRKTPTKSGSHFRESKDHDPAERGGPHTTTGAQGGRKQLFFQGGKQLNGLP